MSNLSHLLLLLLLSVSASSSSGSFVTFGSFCPNIRFNHVLDKYAIDIPVKSSVRIGEIHLSGMPSLVSRDSGISVNFAVKSHNSGVLSILCRTFSRCKQMQTAIRSTPNLLLQSLKMTHIQQRIEAPKLPVRSNCNSGWKVFQQRVDGSLSFAQNFKTYERGFGDPRGNYWMGLKNLHAATAIGNSPNACSLRIRAMDARNKHFKGEYRYFRVASSSNYYKLYVSGLVKGSTIKGFKYHNGYKFSTYDRDYTSRSHCPKAYSNSGWWYRSCFLVNPNGLYGKQIIVHVHTRHFKYPIRKISLEFKCQ